MKGWRLARGIGLALAIGADGGGVFFALHLPLAWMLGAMAFTCAAAIAGVPVALPLQIRSFMIAVLGMLLGSSFTPDVLNRAGHWLGGMAVSVGFVAAITAVVFLFLRRFGPLDRITAFFSASPGGLGPMALAGELYGADSRVIALVHACRVLIVVFTIPFYMRYVVGFETPRLANVTHAVPVAGLQDMGVLVLASLLGYAVFRLLRMPNAQLIGPMVASAAANLVGLAEGRPPVVLIAIAQVVVGAAVGARFVNFPLASMGRIVGLASVSALFMVLGAELFAQATAPLLGIDAHALLLALSPGGLAEMTLVALSMNADTAFVATMHIVRIMLILLAMPFVFRLLGWRPAAI